MNVDDYVRLPAVAADLRHAYGPHDAQFAELYVPKQAGPHPVVIVIHGGCWQAMFGLAQLGSLCRALADEGMAAWSIEYRRLGNGGGWPATFHDVAAAADALRNVAGDAGLNLDRVAALGHSAGGHLALWLAARRHLPHASPLGVANALRVHGVVSIAGVPDLLEVARRGVCDTAGLDLLGGSWDDAPERARHASPALLLPLGVPHRHLVGELDQIVPADLIEPFVGAARRSDDATLEVLPGIGHFDIVVPGTPAWQSVLAAVRGVLPAA